MERENKPHEQIIGMKIPDEDIHQWEKTLKDAGLDDEEIFAILGHMNGQYADIRHGQKAEQILDDTLSYLKQTYDTTLTPEEIKHLKEGISQRPEFKKS
jgi:hypothetical protein